MDTTTYPTAEAFQMEGPVQRPDKLARQGFAALLADAHLARPRASVPLPGPVPLAASPPLEVPRVAARAQGRRVWRLAAAQSLLLLLLECGDHAAASVRRRSSRPAPAAVLPVRRAAVRHAVGVLLRVRVVRRVAPARQGGFTARTAFEAGPHHGDRLLRRRQTRHSVDGRCSVCFFQSLRPSKNCCRRIRGNLRIVGESLHQQGAGCWSCEVGVDTVLGKPFFVASTTSRDRESSSYETVRR